MLPPYPPPSHDNGITISHNRSMIRNSTLAFIAQLKHEANFASTTIQRVFRGYITRVYLWRNNGLLTISRAIKIQKLWRGYVGRRRALERLMWYIDKKAKAVQGLFFIWKAMREARLKRAAFYHKMATRIESMFRNMKSRQLMAWLREQRRIARAIIIQKYTRSYFSRRRVKGIRLRLKAFYDRVSEAKKQYLNLRYNLNKKITIEYVDTKGKNEWELFDLALVYMIGLERPDIALDISLQLNQLYPHFLYATVTLKFALLYGCLFEGRARVHHENYLEEVVGILLAENDKRLKPRSTVISTKDTAVNSNNLNVVGLWNAVGLGLESGLGLGLHTRVGKSNIDPVSRFIPWVMISRVDVNSASDMEQFQRNPDFRLVLTDRQQEDETYEEIEYMYFCNLFKRFGRNTMTLTFMALFVLIRDSVRCFGDDPLLAKRRMRNIERAKRLLESGYKCGSISIIKEVEIRNDMYVDLFCNSLREISSAIVKFKDMAYIDFEKAENIQDKHVFPVVTCNVTIYQTGDMIIVKAIMIQPQPNRQNKRMWPLISRKYQKYLAKDPPSMDDDIDEIDEDDLLDEEEKLDPEVQKRRLRKRLEQLTKDSVDIYIRPLVLSRAEAKFFNELAVKSLAITLKTTEAEVRERGNWTNISEYLMKKVRLTTCSSKFKKPSSMDSADLRIVLPGLEYNRREKNEMKRELYATIDLQRCFRGFKGRSLFRRLFFRAKEMKRQQRLHNSDHQSLLDIKEFRNKKVKVIQSGLRAFLWRNFMKKKHKMATKIQKVFRVFQALQKIRAELHRKKHGPPVIKMIEETQKFENLTLRVVVYRCGANYKIVGKALDEGDVIAEGYIYSQEIQLLIDCFNATIIGNSFEAKNLKLRINQHDRVAQFVYDNLGLVKAMMGLTLELGSKRRGPSLSFVLRKEGVILGKGSLKSIQQTTSTDMLNQEHNRYLIDQESAVIRYYKQIEARSRIKAGIVTKSASMKFLSK